MKMKHSFYFRNLIVTLFFKSGMHTLGRPPHSQLLMSLNTMALLFQTTYVYIFF